MVGDLPGTQIVGFASTIPTKDSTDIISLQPIYYSTDVEICGCLDENPTVSQDTVKIEPPPENESLIDRLTREGKLDTFVNSLISSFSLLIFLAIVVCVLCRLSKSKAPRKQHAFDAFVYIDLAAKTAMRVQNMDQAILYVKRNGYKPKAPTALGHGGAVMNPIEEDVNEELEVQSLGGNSFGPATPHKRKSSRTRAQPTTATAMVEEENSGIIGNDSTMKYQNQKEDLR